MFLLSLQSGLLFLADEIMNADKVLGDNAHGKEQDVSLIHAL